MDEHSQPRWAWRLATIVFLLLTTAIVVSAATLVVDGQFDDWAGQPSVDDPDDGGNPNIDIFTFSWGTNANDDHIYWMIERQSSNGNVYYFVFLDTTNDGDYTDAQDRLVRAFYDPQKNIGEVTVTVFDGTGSQIGQSSGDWGETRGEGGEQAEWRVSFADLGIDAHQTINMYAGAGQNQDPGNIDRVPDAGDITWAPIPVLGWPWLAIVVAAAIGAAWHSRGRFKWH